MTFSEFTSIVGASSEAVVLLEGRRSIPDHDAALATLTARRLVERFPNLRFRSGNAEGTDQAFSEGIAQVAPWRLQVFRPRGLVQTCYFVGSGKVGLLIASVATALRFGGTAASTSRVVQRIAPTRMFWKVGLVQTSSRWPMAV